MLKPIESIETPALLIEKSIMEANLDRMQKLANDNKIMLRPHIKTHKMPRLAKLQVARGARGIACSKVSEAEVFAKAGFKDIQIANIIIGDEKLERLKQLSLNTTRLSVACDSLAGFHKIRKYFEKEGKLDVFIKVDTGFRRAGISRFEDIRALAIEIIHTKGIKFAGLLTHAGQAYSAEDIGELRQIGEHEGRIMTEIKLQLSRHGIEVPEVSVGSTPGAKWSVHGEGITELRAGNYIFYDMIQVGLGSAEIENCALSVQGQVVSTPERTRSVLDTGSKALGLDKGAHGNETTRGHGYMIGKKAVIDRLSEEHGIVINEKDELEIGEKVRIIPNHACAVVNLYDKAYLVDGNVVIEEIAVEARGKSQ